jgi:hypothetical protein
VRSSPAACSTSSSPCESRPGRLPAFFSPRNSVRGTIPAWNGQGRSPSTRCTATGITTSPSGCWSRA